MSYALTLPGTLATYGLTVETVPGWETRSAGSFNPGGAVCHWTAGPATGDRPSLNVCVNGRPGLSGPLCNVFLTRAGVAVVVAAGRANHAGEGGWRGLVGNSAVFGTEAENSGGGEWTAAQRWAYPRICAAYCTIGGFGPDMVCGHNEWAPTRKIDIRDWPMAAMREAIVPLLAGEVEEMQEAEWTRLVGYLRLMEDRLNTRLGTAGATEAKRLVTLQEALTAESTNPAELEAALTRAAASMAPAIAAKVSEALAGSGGAAPIVDPAVIEQAVKDALREGTGA